MNRIFKYTLGLAAEKQIDMPRGASILSVGMQCETLRLGKRETIRLWAHIDDAMPAEPRTFVVYGTGHQTRPPEDLKFIGTVLMMDGDFVWHVFEVIRP